MDTVGQYLFIFIMVCSVFKSEAVVTRNQSLCPTQKISPRRRQASNSSTSSPAFSTGDTGWQEPRPRTLDLLYDLLTPGRPQRQLEEDDCGKSEDFGEKDLSTGLIKPVTEDILDLPQPHYRPVLIGGRLGYIVGFSSRKPPTEDTPTKDRQKAPLKKRIKNRTPLSNFSKLFQIIRDNKKTSRSKV